MSITQGIKNVLRPMVHRLQRSWLADPLCAVLDGLFMLRYAFVRRAKISAADIRNVEDNVTFIYKSFNRQKMAKRLYYSIKSYYPNAAVIIADDSKEPLSIPGADIIHLPFNSGLSKGLIAALDRVNTEYVMRLDDDLLLTRSSNIHGQLKFLQSHHEVDLCAIHQSTRPEESAERYMRIKMRKQLIIPYGTVIEGRMVVYKAPNSFLARTAKLRQVGYDPNIRMNDHYEFFYRAAGVIVSVQDPHANLFHCHNRFDRKYNKYRYDVAEDTAYIKLKHQVALSKQSKQAR